MNLAHQRSLQSPKPYKVACLTTRFSTGGAELNALMLARGFSEQGMEAEIWSLYRAGELDTGEIRNRVMLEKAPRGPAGIVTMGLALHRAVSDFAPDVILGFQPLANIFGSLRMAFSGRFVASQRNPAESQSEFIKRIEALVGSTWLYDANVAVSQAVLDSYGRHPKPYRSRMKVIHNGLPPLHMTSDDKFEARRHFGLPVDVPLVGTIGRLHSQKNQNFLLEVLAMSPGVHLMLAGDGPDRTKLEAAAEDKAVASRVHFVGRVEGEDVTRAYKALDVFLFPSIFEGFGRALIEAMSLNIPLIANDLPITREVTLGITPLLPLDAASWSREISTAIRSCPYSLEEARLRAESFGLQTMIEKYARTIRP